MKTLTLTKLDNPACKAKISAYQIFYDNCTTKIYSSKITYYESGMRLFSQLANVDFLTAQDAIDYAINLAKDNNFTIA